MLTANTLLGVLIWLIPLLIYLFAFMDSPNMRIVWSLVILVFTWPGLLVRLIYGLINANTHAHLP